MLKWVLAIAKIINSSKAYSSKQIYLLNISYLIVEDLIICSLIVPRKDEREDEEWRRDERDTPKGGWYTKKTRSGF